MWRVLHHSPSQRYGILGKLNTSDCSRRQIAAVHNRGVHLLFPLGVERRSASGVEQRIILQLDDCGFYRIQRCAIALQLGDSRRERASQAGPVFAGRLCVHVFPLRGTGAAMYGYRPLDPLLRN